MIQTVSLYVFFYLFSCSFSRGQGLLPIYSTPMVILDQNGNVVGQVPDGYRIINTSDGKHDGGWSKGMAGNTVAAEGLIPLENYTNNERMMIDQKGSVVIDFKRHYSSITPAYEGFHLATITVKKGYFDQSTFYYLDQHGQPVFAKDGYEKATNFREGLAAIKRSGEWRYLDKQGKEHNLLDPSLQSAFMVYPFNEGLSKVEVGPAVKCGVSACYQYVFIDRQGNVVIDTRSLFPDDTIYEMSDFYHGISIVSFVLAKNSGTYNKAFINLKGDVLMHIKNVRRLPDFKNGFAAINTEKSSKDNYAIDSVFIVTPEMKKIFFKTENGFKATEVFDIDGGYYEVFFWSDKEGISKLYNANTGQFIALPKAGDVMGVNGKLLSLKNSNENRFYVLDLTNGKTVYDTKVGNRLYTNIEGALDFPSEVMQYSCYDQSDLPYLNQLISLKELTLHQLDIESIPLNVDFSALETLRLDGLMNLKFFPIHITGLKKLSLRDCVQATNLMDFLKLQTNLQVLYLINFDLTEGHLATINDLFPGAKINISGNAKLADSQIQEYIDGF